METKFNFKSAICTSRVQSERLLALGLKKETADMYLQSVLNDKWSPFVPIAFPYSDRPEEIIAPDVVNVIPAWSLHRLIELICGDGEHYMSIETHRPFEDCIERIDYMINQSHCFNKKYLEE